MSATLGLVACGSGRGEGALAVGTPGTTTLAPSTAVPERATTTSVPAGEYVNGVPQVKASPTQGTPGTRVRIEGYGFTEPNWQQAGAPLWLVATRGICDLFAEADHTVTVTTAGHLTGELTIPATGACRQSGTGDVPLQSGSYRIAFQCTACHVGLIDVTASPTPAPVRCQNVALTPNSDNIAIKIVATGVSCPAAEAFIRRVAGPLGPVNGLPRLDAEGFICVRTGQEDVGLPSATYSCTSGARTITFQR